MASNDPTTVSLQQQAAATQNLSQETSNFAKVIKDLDTISGDYVGTVAKLTAAYGSLGIAQNVFSSDAYKVIVGGSEEMAKIPKLLASEIIGSNVLLSENMNNATDAMTRNALAMQKAVYADQERLTDHQIQIGERNGKAIYGQMVDYFKNGSELGETFYKSAMAETRLYDAALQATSELGQERLYQMKVTSALAVKGLQMDAKDMTAIFQEEFSKTGKISGDLVEKFSATILAAAKETGLGLRQLTEDSKIMLQDVEHFGNMTYAQMTSLSAAVHKLGLDMNDVTRVTDKFVSFENASQAIANIGAVTGATLDTMEMFYLANEDKEEFFRTMRQSLLDQGVTLENLSHQEQVYLSRQMGFNSVRQLQSLLNEEIDFTTGNISDKIAEAAEGQEYVGDQLTAQLAQAGGLAQETLNAMTPEGIQARMTAVKNLAGGTNELFEATTQLKLSLSNMANEGLPALTKAAGVFKTGFVIAMKEAQAAGNDLKAWWDTFVKTAVPPAARPASVPPMYADFIKGINIMVGEAEAILNRMPEGHQKAFAASAKATLESVAKTSIDAGALFDKLRKEHESKIKEISKFEKDLIAEQKSRMTEAKNVEEELKNQLLSYNVNEASENVQKKFGGGANEKLTDDDVAKVLEGVLKGNTGVLAEVAMSGMSDKLKEAATKYAASAASTSTATTPASAAAAGTGTPAVPGASAPAAEVARPAAGPIAADGNLNIKVKLELVKDDLIALIKSEILPEAIAGGITLNNDVGSYSRGNYQFVLDEKKSG